MSEPEVETTTDIITTDSTDTTTYATEDTTLEFLGNTSLLNTTVKPPKTPEESHTLPVLIFTAVFGLIFILAPLFVRRGPNRSITRVCIMLSTVCCWIFWTTTYIVQMNPLLGPRLSNHSLAWIGYKWGHDPASLGAASMNDTETTKEPMFNESDLDSVKKGDGNNLEIKGDSASDNKDGENTNPDLVSDNSEGGDNKGPEGGRAGGGVVFIDESDPGPGP